MLYLVSRYLSNNLYGVTSQKKNVHIPCREKLKTHEDLFKNWSPASS
jgi:hypothetical protein